MIRRSITRAVVASFALFPTVFKVLKNVGEVLQTFTLTRSSQKTFANPKFVIDNARYFKSASYFALPRF